MARTPNNLAGQVFGKLMVLHEQRCQVSTTTWSCRCSCGFMREVPERALLQGRVTSCGNCRATLSAIAEGEALAAQLAADPDYIEKLIRRSREHFLNEAIRANRKFAEAYNAARKNYPEYVAGLLAGGRLRNHKAAIAALTKAKSAPSTTTTTITTTTVTTITKENQHGKNA